VDRARLPSLPDDEFYYSDLIGLAVHDTGGVAMGRVIAVHNHGAGDLLEVQPEGPKAAILLPFTKAIVPTVDLNARRVIVDVPEGLD
ncbi:MAG: ribosome maturation factor RimM, partial [Paracoccaceae bacterium]